MKKVIKLKEQDLNRIIENVVREQHGAGPWFGNPPGPASYTERQVTVPVKMNGSLFLNGIDVINTNSDQFKKGVDAIRMALMKTKDLTVNVQGGASAVGNQNGYDNTSLAKRRSSNFIKEIQSLFPNVKFTQGSPVVGVATVKNSPEANAEQFIKLSFNTTQSQLSMKQAVDNTANVMRGNSSTGNKLTPKPNDVMVTKCFKIPSSQLAMFEKIVSSLGLTMV